MLITMLITSGDIAYPMRDPCELHGERLPCAECDRMLSQFSAAIRRAIWAREHSCPWNPRYKRPFTALRSKAFASRT